MKKFVRAVFPMLIVLRLADQKDPVMDKLFFYVRRMDKTLEKSKDILDDLEEKTKGVSWRLLNDLDDCDDELDDSESHDDTNVIDYSSEETADEVDEAQPEKTLGQKVIDIWQKRRAKLVSDFAEIFEDSLDRQIGVHNSFFCGRIIITTSIGKHFGQFRLVAGSTSYQSDKN